MIATFRAWWGSWTRRRVPEVLQSEMSECGASCLAMVLAHFGRWEPLGELRTLCGVGRDGVSAGTLVRAAGRLGLQAKGFGVAAEGLDALPLPQILFWNFNHFVVLERLDARHADVVDPAIGRRRLTRADLDAAYSGVALCFAPGADFVRGGHAPSALREMREAAVGAGPAIAAISIVSLAIALLTVVIPALSSIFIDYVLIKRSIGYWHWEYVLGIALLGLVVAPAYALQRAGVLRLQTRLALTLATRITRRLFVLPTAFFRQRYSGDVGGRVMLADAAAGTVSGPLVNMIAAAIQVVVIGLVMVGYSPHLAALVFALLAAHAVLGSWVTQRLATLSRRLALERGRYEAQLLQNVALVEHARAAGLARELAARTLGRHIALTNAEQVNAPYAALLATAPGAMTGVLIALVTALSAVEVLAGGFSIGMFVAFNALAALLFTPFNQIVTGVAQVGGASGSFDRINDLLRTAPEPRLERRGGIRPSAWHLALRDVTHAYGAKPVLEGVSLELPPGSRVGIVGGVGAGKSTLLQILAHLAEPSAGEVLADGTPYAKLDRDAFCAAVAYVPQHIDIFEGTLLDNVTLWDKALTEEDVAAACRLCALHDDIVRRPGGYRSRVREGGADLSGGQRQRIGLARALVRKPRVLLLDEATSALDVPTESAILEALREADCTVVFASHRLSAMGVVDRVVVLERGRIVESGARETLADGNGRYARLLRAEGAPA